MTSEFICTLQLLGNDVPLSRDERLKVDAFNAGVKLRGQYDEGFVSDRQLRHGLRMHVVVTDVTDKLTMDERFTLLDSARLGAGLKQ